MGAPERLLALARAWYARGHLEEALELFEAAHLTAAALGERAMEAEAWTQLGRASTLECEPQVAEHAFGRAAECFAALGRHDDVLVTRLRQAFVAYDAGALDRSTEILDAVASEPAAPAAIRGRAEGYRANVLRSRGALRDAERGYLAAIEILEEARDAVYAATFRMDLGITQLLLGDPKTALEALDEARRSAAASPPEPMLVALIAHYEIVALAAVGAVARAAERASAFRAPRSVAMDFLAATHALLPALAERGASPIAELEHALAQLRGRCPPYEHARLTMRLLRGMLGGSTARDDRLLLFVDEQTARLGADLTLTFPEDSAEWRILVALAAQREREPGVAVAPGALVLAGWPDERLGKKSAKNRLHVALSHLRTRGLREVLLRHHDGYALSATVEVVQMPPAHSESE